MQISLIMPCFNSGAEAVILLRKLNNYLDRDSEVIVTDDASTDNSVILLNDIKDSLSFNLKIITNKENRGPGFSRNRGIEEATCEYISFIDSDDDLSPDFFTEIEKAIELKPDGICFDYYLQSNGEKKGKCSFFTDIPGTGFIDTKTAVAFSRGCPWGKAYKRSVVVENKAEFLNLYRGEDNPFTKTALAFCKTVYYIKKPLYIYVNNSNSLMHNDKLLSSNNAYIGFDYIESRLKKDWPSETEAIYIHDLLYRVAFTELKFCGRKDWKEKIDGLIKKYPDFLNNPYLKMCSKTFRIIVKLIFKKRYYALKIIGKIK